MVITFVLENPSDPISVGPIEVTACAEAGNEALHMYELYIFQINCYCCRRLLFQQYS